MSEGEKRHADVGTGAGKDALATAMGVLPAGRPPNALAGGVPNVSPVPSPCIQVCQIDAASAWCEGCQRSLDEIAAWSSLDDAAKRAIWAQLEPRRLAMAQAASDRWATE